MKQVILYQLATATLIALNATALTVPDLINYQGSLVNSNGVPLATADYKLTFSVYDAPTSGTRLWGPQVFDGSTAVGHGLKIPIVQGYFNLMLGPKDVNDSSLSLALASRATCFLEILVEDNPPVSPRQQLLSAPFAHKSEWAAFAGDARFATNAQQAVNAQSAVNAQNAANANTLAGRNWGLVFENASSPENGRIKDGILPLNVVRRSSLTRLYNSGAADNDPLIEAVQVDGRGRVGIGINPSSPSNTLHVVDDIQGSGTIRVGAAVPNAQPKLIKFGDGDNVMLGEAGADNRMLAKADSIFLNIGSGSSSSVQILGGFGDVSLSGGASFQIGYSTNNNLAFDNNEIMARNAGESSDLYLNRDGGNVIIGQFGRSGGDLLVNRLFVGDTPRIKQLEVAGEASKATAGSWLANSDQRIKHDIQTITNGLEALNRLRLVSFRYTEDYLHNHPHIEDRTYLNVIAQEFAQVFPECVHGSGEKMPDGSEILQVDSWPVTIYAATAAQELHRLVQRQQAELQELKARLDRLEASCRGHQARE